MSTPPPFFSNHSSENNVRDSSSSGEPINDHNPPEFNALSTANTSLPPPQEASTDSEDEIQALQAQYNDTPPPPNLVDSHTIGTPEPMPNMPPPPPTQESNSPIYRVPPPPAYSKTASPPPEQSLYSRPPPQVNRGRQYSKNNGNSANVPPPPHSYANAPKRQRSGMNQRQKHIQPQGNGLIMGNGGRDDGKRQELIDQISFNTIMRQVDVGVEMTDRLKDVIRKFCKHQKLGADKLQEIYSKLPSTYQDTDGLKDFADLCALVHTLILETVSAQKRLADFLAKDVVPKMDIYIKEKQSAILQLKRNDTQAQAKVKNAINAMDKASHLAKSTAHKAKQLAQAAHSQGKRAKFESENKRKKGGGLGGLVKKFGKHNPNSNLPEDEQAYLKAQTNQLNYEATVMAANYEKDTYNEIQARFKRDCKGIEQQRVQYCHQKIQHFVNAHRNYFNNETIMVLQTRILSGLDSLDFNKEFDTYLKQKLTDSKSTQKNQEFIATKYDYQNVFHSLQDSMDITAKLAPHSKLPLLLTTLCNKVRGLNGFETEGIFRKSAMATEIDRLKQKLSRNEYTIDTKDPHVAACLLKDWLRGLTDSLIPQTHYSMAIQMAKKNEINHQSLEVFLSQLPEVNRETIKYLVTFLKDLIEEKHVPKTRMNIENVAIVFAPTILKCPSADMKQLMANSRHEKAFTIALIQQLQTY